MTFPVYILKRYRINSDRQIIEYEVVHRPRVTRCIHLELAEHGTLQVVAPRRMSKRLIQSTMQEWAGYVSQFLVEAQARQQETPVLNYSSGENHLFMGQYYPLSLEETETRRARVRLFNEQIEVYACATDRESIRALLKKWYRQQAQRHFAERMKAISQLAPWTGRKMPVMRLRQMKRTWGSCSASGVITFNPHLVKAPPECIDYVVAHEICHLREHNHSKAFYALQQQLYPGWKAAKDNLQRQAHIFLHG